MMKEKYFIQAEKQLEKRRSENAQKQEENIKKAEASIAELSHLRTRQSQQGMKIAKIIIGGGDIKEKIQSLSEENLDIQRKIKELLIKNKFPDNFLDEIYTCKYCKDTGVYDNKICVCKQELAKKFECDDLNNASKMELTGFDEFDLNFYPDEPLKQGGQSIRKIMESNLRFCKKYAEDFHLPCENLVMKGKTGLGKTHLSLAIANEVMKKGYSVVYGSAPELFRKIEQEHFNSSIEPVTLELLETADLLILDDLGAEFESKFYAATLYELVNYRINAAKPMIINTNLEINEMQQRYGDRTTSRLLTMELLTFFGSDIRVKKKYAKG